MKKLLYTILILGIVAIAIADDHIIRIVTNSGTVSVLSSQVKNITYDYHDQDSIDKAYADSLRAAFVADSLYMDSLRKDSITRDSIGRLNTVGYKMEKTDAYTIFTAALKLTGLYDALNVVDIKRFNGTVNKQDTNGGLLYCPTESRNGFTVFAETDSVFGVSGITNLSDLVAYANKEYGSAPDWYDYMAESGITVSTGSDYTSEWNALHMFMAYHILKNSIPEDQLVYERNAQWQRAYTWNYVNGETPYDYYETMLPNTLIKVWQPEPFRPQRSLYLNRYIANNTLTDEVGTKGSSAMHQVISKGVRVNRTTENVDDAPSNLQAYNGYIHPINSILVYNKDVPQGVLHERMRFDFISMQPELGNNGFRYMTSQEVSALNEGGNGARIAYPNDYFENIRVYDAYTYMRVNVKGAYNCYMSDAFTIWGNYDLSVKMPPLPAGTYEVRIAFSPLSQGGTVRYAWGKDADNKDAFETLCEQDLTIPASEPPISSTPFYEEADLGIASDSAMRERGYMRGPFSFVDHPERADGNSTDRNMRSDRSNALFRKIVGRVTIKQNENNWLRLNNLKPSVELRNMLDFIEFVPIDVVDNQTYMEDWY